jgi:pimeloyl-ACP methyl ester carboxylesterase
MIAPRRLRHGNLEIALYELRVSAGERLLLLHELGASGVEWGAEVEAWPGPVVALDFAGHGASGWRRGGAYTPELFAADADVALAALGPCRIAGAGLGAYVALLVAGARPELVPAALLLPGAGLDGGGPLPDPTRVRRLAATLEAMAIGGAPCDPLVRTCANDVRPPVYATAFAAAARSLLLGADDGPRPPWWRAVAEVPGAGRVSADRTRALGALARLACR